MFLGEGRTDDGQVVLLGVLNQQPIDKPAVLVLLLQPRQTAPELLLQRQLHLPPNPALLLQGLSKDAIAGPDEFVGMGEHFSGGGGVFHVK